MKRVLITIMISNKVYMCKSEKERKNRQLDRQTYKYIDIQTDRQMYRYMYRERLLCWQLQK